MADWARSIREAGVAASKSGDQLVLGRIKGEVFVEDTRLDLREGRDRGEVFVTLEAMEEVEEVLERTGGGTDVSVDGSIDLSVRLLLLSLSPLSPL